MAIEQRIDASDEWFAGEAKVLRFTVRDDDEAVVDVTGWATALHIAESEEDEPILTAAGTVTSGENGQITVAVPAASTAELGGRVVVFTLWRTDVGSEAVLAYGAAVLRQGVTA